MSLVRFSIVEAAHPAVADEDVGAGTEDEHRLAAGFREGVSEAQLVLVLGGHVDVRRTADAEGDVSADRLVETDLSEVSELLQ